MKPRVLFMLLGLSVLAAASVALRLSIGPSLGSFDDHIRAQMLELRLVRVAAGAVVGICLAIAGVMMQSLMRNPLASPDIMGMSAGAGLAVMITRLLGGVAIANSPSWLGSAAWETGPALAGSLGALAIVYFLSQRRGLVSPVSLVLIGVMVSVLCGAGIMLVQHLMPGGAMGSTRMLAGAISDETSRAGVLIAACVALGGLTLGLVLATAMDASSLGIDEALSVGVRIGRLRLLLLLAAGTLTATAVVLAGPLGFVGLVCPHVVRLLAGRADSGGWWGVHRPRLIGAALAGITLVVGGDAIVRVLDFGSGRLPLGVVMAFVGAPIFVLLLRRGWAGEP
ncbi:MAG: iron ABC transporter permease [Pyrinomonadaceae bacterium]|nr:iron ABC transporter permease [Phycisphaerales bacterium]